MDHRVRPEWRDDPTCEARFAHGHMMRKRIERRMGGSQYLKSKSFEKSAGAKFRFFQFFRYGVVVFVSILRRKTLIQSEEIVKSKVQPQPCRCRAEKIIVAGEDPPNPSGIANIQVLKQDTLAVKHARNVVVGGDEQLGRIWKGLV